MTSYIVRYVFQPIADFVMNRWELSCYWLSARAAIAFGVLGSMSMLVVMIEAFAKGIGFISLVFMPPMFFWALWGMQGYHIATAEDRRDRDTLRVERFDESIWRLMSPFMLTYDIYTFVDKPDAQGIVLTLCSTALMSHYYFLACIPHPPRKRARKRQLAWA